MAKNKKINGFSAGISREEEENDDFRKLEAAYEAAKLDKERQKVIEEWSVFDKVDETRDWKW